MTATLPPRVDTRDCRLYRFWVLHPVTGKRVLGYVGETVRLPFERLLEHVYSQPWADTIVAWEVDDRVFPGKDAVLAAEKAAVEAERPLYNYEFNLGNPHRVEIWRAKEQRWARDDKEGRPRWTPPKERAVTTAPAAPAGWGRRTVTAVRLWRPWQQKLALWTIGWTSSTMVLWGSFARLDTSDGWRSQAATAAAVSAGALLWSVRRRPKRRRRRR